jgi:hypothetical protein
MRKRIEEELAKLAFGELEANDAKRLELSTMGDPEAERAFETYMRMKEELRALSSEVPADQLSKERLREAILTRGLKDRHPSASRLSWTWVPVAAALAFGLFFMKGWMPGGSSGAMVVDNSTTIATTPIPGVGVERPDPIESSPFGSSRVKVFAESAPTQVASETTPKSRARKRSRGIQSPSDIAVESADLSDGLANLPSFDGEFEESPTYAARTVSFGSDESAGMSMAAPAPMSAAPVDEPTIVVIQSETDRNTGTLKATEVESTANVVIGG